MHMNHVMSDWDPELETPLTNEGRLAQQAGILPRRHRDRDVTDLSYVIARSLFRLCEILASDYKSPSRLISVRTEIKPNVYWF